MDFMTAKIKYAYWKLVLKEYLFRWKMWIKGYFRFPSFRMSCIYTNQLMMDSLKKLHQENDDMRKASIQLKDSGKITKEFFDWLEQKE